MEDTEQDKIKKQIKNYCDKINLSEGIIYKDIILLKDFCEKHNLNRKCMSAVFLENKKSYKKWAKYKPNN